MTELRESAPLQQLHTRVDSLQFVPVLRLSALRDRRFSPIQARELPYLECTVSLLTDYETAANYLDWKVGKYGMILEFTDPDSAGWSATYLPEVAAQEGKLTSSLDAYPIANGSSSLKF